MEFKTKLNRFIQWVVDWIMTFIYSCGLAFFMIFCVASVSTVPSESMENTILIGDKILTSSLSYYFDNPERGDVAVFWQDGKRWIKRVIGLPNDVIDIKDGYVYVNNEKIDETDYVARDGVTGLSSIMDSVTFPYVVPKYSYFMLGDNRESSKDSRYIGAIHRLKINGKAIMKVYPFDRFGLLK